MLIDTHCHLNIMVKKDFDTYMTATEVASAESIINEAREADVTRIINVGTSLIESINCLELAKQYREAYAVVGIHPNDLADAWQDDLASLNKYLVDSEKHKIVGIGECGIDRHYPGYNLERQKHAFCTQIELALKHNKALVVHSRDAEDETLSCLAKFDGELLRGTFHCFSYDKSIAEEAIKRNFVLGIGGTVTYPRNDLLRAAVKAVPLESLVLETDAPYLTPQVKRGQRNHPANIKDIAQYLATLRDIEYDTIAQTTTQSALTLFAL